MTASTPAKTSQSRVWLIEGRARPDRSPSFQSCMRAGAVSQAFGDIERIECPDPTAYNKFIEVGSIQGAEERATSSVEGRFPINLTSTLLRMARKRCAFDVQYHFGTCTNPETFTAFKKVMILEEAHFTSYSTEDLGALASGDNAAVNETGEISAARVYEVVPLSFGAKAEAIITNEILDVVICDSLSCGDCEVESDGCQKIFALSTAAGGSPGTPADVVYSLDKGVTWYAADIDTLGAAEVPSALDCLGNYLVVVSGLGLVSSLHYVLKSELDGTTDPAWTEVTTGFVAGSGPLAIKEIDGVAFIVGENGYVYLCEDPTAGVDVLDAGSATTNHLKAVDALSETFAVAVGENSTIIKTENQSAWTLLTPPTGVGIHYNCVAVKTEDEWWIGTSNGKLYATYDGGDTWTEVTFSGSGSGAVYDIVFATDSVVYVAHQTAATRARILRSIDGGAHFVTTPEDSTLPLEDKINSLAVCTFDANFLVAGGLADNGADGAILIGQGV